MVKREFNINTDVNAFLKEEMSKLQQFAPLSRRLLLAADGGKIVSWVFMELILKQLTAYNAD
ncbi:MAG: hypothetical protein VKL59_01625 [Nostocaceae cyanobacterium]|nr:hypothetical protein [Nostocaceae cyanobacterium]